MYPNKAIKQLPLLPPGGFKSRIDESENVETSQS